MGWSLRVSAWAVTTMVLVFGASGYGEKSNAADQLAGTVGSAAPVLEVARPTDEGLPGGYVIPQYIYDAGDPKTCSMWIRERYPEFYGRQGGSLVQAAGQHPVRYHEMIRASRTRRQVCADDVERPADNIGTASSERNPENQTPTP